MKNSIISKLLISILIVGTFSCEGFLDVLPSDSATASTSIVNPNDAQVAINGAYRRMTSSSFYGRDIVLYGELRGADFGITTLAVAGDALYYFTSTPSSGSYSGFWTQGYDIILQTNNILEAIESGNMNIITTSDQAKVNSIAGQALTIRALTHFDLTRLYGYPYMKDNGVGLGVPIVTKRLEPMDKMARNTVAECYEQVIKDLDAAIVLLSSTTAKVTGEVNLYAAKALLARVYLHKGDWDKAYEMAKSVIDSGVYTAYTAANWVASWSKQGDTESIFELMIVPNESNMGTTSIGGYYAPRNTSRRDLGPMMVSDMFLDVFKLPAHANDVRWGVYGLDEFSNGETKDTNGNPLIIIPGRLGWLKKYESDGKSPAMSVNVKLIRLTEVMLIAAEAAIKKSSQDKTNAVVWINKIRERNPDMVATPLAATDADNVLLDEIVLQRRIDLIGEGHRYFDVLRVGGTVTYKDGAPWNDPLNGGRGSTVDWNYHKCILPIAINEMNVNPNMVQNPGY